MKVSSPQLKKLLIFSNKKVFLIFQEETWKSRKTKFSYIPEKNICEVSTAAKEKPYEIGKAAREILVKQILQRGIKKIGRLELSNE